MVDMLQQIRAEREHKELARPTQNGVRNFSALKKMANKIKYPSTNGMPRTMRRFFQLRAWRHIRSFCRHRNTESKTQEMALWIYGRAALSRSLTRWWSRTSAMQVAVLQCLERNLGWAITRWRGNVTGVWPTPLAPPIESGSDSTVPVEYREVSPRKKLMMSVPNSLPDAASDERPVGFTPESRPEVASPGYVAEIYRRNHVETPKRKPVVRRKPKSVLDVADLDAERPEAGDNGSTPNKASIMRSQGHCGTADAGSRATLSHRSDVRRSECIGSAGIGAPSKRQVPPITRSITERQGKAETRKREQQMSSLFAPQLQDGRSLTHHAQVLPLKFLLGFVFLCLVDNQGHISNSSVADPDDCVRQ